MTTPKSGALFFLLAALLITPLSAFAQEAETAERLSDTMETLKTETAKKERLGSDAKKLRGELSKLQKELVATASRIQEKEKALSAAEERLSALEAEAKEKTAARELRQKQLAIMVESLIRLSRTPKAAVLAMPGDYATTLRTAKVLGVTSDAVQVEAEALRLKLTEIQLLQQQIGTERETALAEREALERERTNLTTKLAARNKAQDTLFSEEKRSSQRVVELSRQSANLRELLVSLEAKRNDRVQTAKAKPAGGKLRGLAKARGSLRWPTPGSVISRYGEDGDKGITLRTAANASVVAPYDGQVVFTGPFLNYGRMVILRHEGGYHSLVAGLAKIDCKPGEFLLEGEPIGAMGKKNTLYMELREDNRPVDPLPWLRPA